MLAEGRLAGNGVDWIVGISPLSSVSKSLSGSGSVTPVLAGAPLAPMLPPMLRAGSALSTHPDTAAAVSEAAAAALANCDASRADAAVVFATPHHESDAESLVRTAADVLATPNLAGAIGAGVIAGSREEQTNPAVAVLALTGLEAVPVWIPAPAGMEDAAGVELEAQLGGSAAETDLVLVWMDPLACDVTRLVRGLADTLAPAALAGAGAVLGSGGAAVQWSGGHVMRGGLSGLVLRGTAPPRLVVTQGCRPITDPLIATRCEGHWVLELNHRPALEVYREVARYPLAEDLRRASGRVLVALPRSAHANPSSGDFVVRNVSGFDEERGGFAVSEALRAGTRLTLALRDGDLAREELKRSLDLAAAGNARAAIYLSCTGRGRSLFGHEGLEAGYLDQALACPLAGLFGSFQIGPIAGRTERLAYAGVLALLDGGG